MSTFSQLVDELVAETKRPDLLTEIVTYLNQTIREVHFEPSRGNVLFYESNRREAAITATLAEAQTWEIPDVATFQGVEAVRFPAAYAGTLEYAKRVSPGPRLATEPYFWYRAGKTLVFGGTHGYGGIGGLIYVSYFAYPKSLKYYTVGERPATYDSDTGFTYHTVAATDYNADDSSRELAESLTTNWILLRWADVLREGLRAKIYKRLSDEVRQRTSYSLFMQLRQGIFTSEQAQIYGG